MLVWMVEFSHRLIQNKYKLMLLYSNPIIIVLKVVSHSNKKLFLHTQILPLCYLGSKICHDGLVGDKVHWISVSLYCNLTSPLRSLDNSGDLKISSW